MKAQTTTLPGAVRNVVQRVLSGLCVSQPGVIESYNDQTGRATVRPVLRDWYRDRAGDRQTERQPPVTEVPLLVLGSGGRRIKYPISRGDGVLLVYSQQSLDTWLATGGTDVDDPLDRRHHPSDAIGICGLEHLLEDGSPMLEFTAGGQIHAGGSSRLGLASQMAALRNAVATALDACTGGDGSAVAAVDVSGTDILRGS